MGRRNLFISLLLVPLIGWAVAEYLTGAPEPAREARQKAAIKPLEDRLIALSNSETKNAPRNFPKERTKGLLNNDVISSVEVDQLKPAPGEIVSPESPPMQLPPAMTPIPTNFPPTPFPTLQGAKDESKFFTPEEIREIEALSRDQNDSNLGGLGVRVGGSAPRVVATNFARPTSTPTGAKLTRVRGQARGFTILSLMQPEARASVEGMIQTLLESEVETLYLGVLVDGTFSLDFPYLEGVVRRLNADGRSLLLVLYFTNGPTMRDHETTSITAGFNKIEPAIFRNLIIYDRQTQDEFAQIVRRARPVLDLNRSLNPLSQNVAIVMLEDNLDAESYRTMRGIAANELGTTTTLIRNPCVGCYDGNDQFSYGDGLESHKPADLESTLTPKDGFSLDGISYRYPDEAADGTPSYEEALRLMGVSASRGTRYFGLWRSARQGIEAGVDELPHPSTRIYEIPTASQRAFDIALLREGLIEK